MSNKTQTHLPTAFDHDMWRPLLTNAGFTSVVSQDAKHQLDSLTADRDIRHLLHEYAYAYDSNDIDRVVETFADDGIVVNPRGTFVSSQAIRDNYAYLITTRRYSFHHVSNLIVKLSDDLQTASATSYWSDKHVGRSGSIDGSDGTYVDMLGKRDGVWKIVERRVTANIFYVITPMADPWPAPPKPTKSETTRDWVGASYMR